MSIAESEAKEQRITNETIERNPSLPPTRDNVSLGSGLSKLAGLWAEYTSPAANPEGLRQKLKELGALQSKMQTEADTNAKDKDDSDPGNLGAPFTPGPGGNANL